LILYVAHARGHCKSGGFVLQSCGRLAGLLRREPSIMDKEFRARTLCLVVLTVIAVGGALYVLRPVLVPFVLSLFLVAGIAPVLSAIETRFRAPRIVAVGVTFVLGLCLLGLLWALIYASVGTLIDDAPTYRKRLGELAGRVESWIPSDPLQRQGASEKSSDSTSDADASAENLAGSSGKAESESAEAADHKGANALSKFISENTGTWVSQLTGALMELLSSAVIVLIFMFFLILGDATRVPEATGVWKEIESSIRNYIVTKGLISLFTGLAFGVALWFFGVPLALVFGLLAFLLNFIPNIGPIIASLLPLPLILLDPEMSVWSMALAIIVTSGIQMVSGNVIEPKIMGESFELHPVAVLLSLMLWGMIWGIVGMFLAVPITAAIKILLERFEQTKPVADLMAGKLEALNRLGEEKEEGGRRKEEGGKR
jgi:AI-2 transport protein TqsA